MKLWGIVVAAGALLVVGAAAPGTRAPAQTLVRIAMTAESCRANPVAVGPGNMAFVVRNRTRRPRLFTIAGRRTRYVPPRHSRTLRVQLTRTGIYRYFCISTRPRRAVRTGVVGVRPPPAPPPPAPEHRIAVRLAGGAGEFYDRRTGARFAPRGSNYLRRADQALPDGRVVFRGSTFIVGLYDPARIEAALETMHADGYNAARVILDVACRRGCLGNFGTGGLSSGYLDNVTDFLRRAKANSIYVVLTNEGSVPAGTTWEATVNKSCCTTFAGTNLYYLTTGGIEGTQQFWRAFLGGLLIRRAPLDVVLGYSLVNEAYFESDKPPLSQAFGTVTTANGRTYDLASPSDRQRMMDENLVNFADRVRAAIREVDPTALVGMGFFWPQAPNPARGGDPRLIRTGPMIHDSALDYVDLHLYPGLELSFQEYTENFELTRVTEKPVMLGEYGAFKPSAPTADQAASTLVEWQRDSCLYGFDGWFLWTWDTTNEAPGEPDLWTAVDEGGVIERALAPAHRPDPCG
jgi:Cellulase (glycosyl hydrolase family 5)